jgi:hypothetical protein
MEYTAISHSRFSHRKMPLFHRSMDESFRRLDLHEKSRGIRQRKENSYATIWKLLLQTAWDLAPQFSL